MVVALLFPSLATAGPKSIEFRVDRSRSSRVDRVKTLFWSKLSKIEDRGTKQRNEIIDFRVTPSGKAHHDYHDHDALSRELK